MIGRLVRYIRLQLTAKPLSLVIAGRSNKTNPHKFYLGDVEVELLIGGYRLSLKRLSNLYPYLLSEVNVAIRFTAKRGTLTGYEQQLLCNYFGGIIGDVCDVHTQELARIANAVNESTHHNVMMAMSVSNGNDDSVDNTVGLFRFGGGNWTWFTPDNVECEAHKHQVIVEEWNAGLHSEDQLLNPNLLEVNKIVNAELVDIDQLKAEGIELPHNWEPGETTWLVQFSEELGKRIWDVTGDFRVSSFVGKTGDDEVVCVYSDDGNTDTSIITQLECNEHWSGEDGAWSSEEFIDMLKMLIRSSK